VNFYGLARVRAREKPRVSASFQAWRFRLKRRRSPALASFPVPLPMRNSRNSIVYYLFFASPKAVAKKNHH
jgi:hypothetical protein